jgi:PadR family transcriptional regulator AphA
VSTQLTTTQYAILGQLALREWGAYELTRSMSRTLRWFWPTAQSGIYAEARRLEASGLARSRKEPAEDGSRRSRTVYAITPSGRRALRRWLAESPTVVQSQVEPFLRVHLARFGTVDDLRRAADAADEAARDLLQDAVDVAQEFLTGTHLFQEDQHFRGLLFDGLWAQGLALQRWAAETRKEVRRWSDLDGDDRARRRAARHMRAALREADQLGITPRV